jgi:hypothetical protein
MTVFDRAKAKRKARRALGADCPQPLLMVTQLNAAALATLGAQAGNTQNTYVTAFIKSLKLFFAVGIPEPDRSTLETNIKLQFSLRKVPRVTYLSRIGNLHAEMAVVQHVVLNVGISKNQLANDLFVACSGKPVCADCCGWMVAHHINHGLVCSEKGSAQGWMHPLSGATYRGEADDDFTFTKSRKYQSSATLLNPDPRRVQSGGTT